MTNTVWSREFSDIVGRIYEAATDPAVWPEVLRTLCQVFEATAGVMSYHELVEQRALLAAEYGIDVDVVRAEALDRFSQSQADIAQIFI